MSRSPLPARLEIEPRGPLAGQISVPGSKSITNRALLLAALAEGESELSGGLESDDTIVMRAALEALGIRVDVTGPSWRVGPWRPLRAPEPSPRLWQLRHDREIGRASCRERV